MPKPDISTVASKKPRETAGSDAVRAFDFQMNVSMARILELHQAGVQYLALFDHHDDLVLFVGDGEEAELSFYQVKSTTELTWTASRLAYRAARGDLPRSIIGKAYYNVAQFGPDIRRAAILSNRPLNALLAPDETPAPHDGEIVLADLCPNDHGILVKSLKKDFPAGIDEGHTKLLMFERVALDPESHRATVLGQVVALLEKIHPDSAACASPFYVSLLAEVSGCTGNKARSASVAELKQRKGLDRGEIDAMIGRAQARLKTVVEWWPSVQIELTGTGLRALAVEQVRVRCLHYWRARQRGERDACELSDAIKAAIAKSSLAGMDSVLDAAVAVKGHDLVGPSSSMYDLQSALIVELMEFMT
ncbi:DUF4297 domain-containing protein [Ensifer sp. IC3342]|nr:DUF4297 domain-containing protein [Ensifer sp. BRP08]MCA1445037.1 DUF4297 domain-containing protein [Ensifer sp. IC3342]